MEIKECFAQLQSEQQFKDHVLISALQITQCIEGDIISSFIQIHDNLGLGSVFKTVSCSNMWKIRLSSSMWEEQILPRIFLMLSQEQAGICNCLCRSFCFLSKFFSNNSSAINAVQLLWLEAQKSSRLHWEMNSVLTAYSYLIRWSPLCVVLVLGG